MENAQTKPKVDNLKKKGGANSVYTSPTETGSTEKRRKKT